MSFLLLLQLIKSGRCPEDCSFCSQSIRHKSDAPRYGLLPEDQIVNQAMQAADCGATCFSIVTSGKNVPEGREFETIKQAVKDISNRSTINTCTSLGIMNKKQLQQLKENGLKRFHHNLETSRSFFRNMCTTHSYEDRVLTVKNAKEVGLEVCCGGIFGLGETPDQRIELAMTLRGLDVDSIPINILHPIPGTKAEKAPSLTPLETLRLVATYRFIFPSKDVGVLGGRSSRMGDLQCMVLVAGANVILLGNYLTTAGRPPEDDRKMIKDLGLEE